MSNDHFDGMTLNERLFSARLIEEFDVADIDRERDAIIAILTKVVVRDAEWTADAILTTPERSGS